VRKYLLALPEADRERPEWQRTARLLLKAAQGRDLKELEDQIRRCAQDGR
jgi:hypothetical protein